MEITIEVKGLKELMNKLQAFPKAMKKAERSAVDTTATAVKNLAINEATRLYNIKETKRLTKDSRGHDTIYVKRSTQTASIAVVTFKGGSNAKSGDRPGLQHFATNKPPAKRKKGWEPTYKIKRSGGSKSIPRGFYGEGKLKGQGIFQRKADGSNKIVRRTGIGMKQIAESKEVLLRIQNEGQALLKKKMGEAIKKQIEKMKG